MLSAATVVMRCDNDYITGGGWWRLWWDTTTNAACSRPVPGSPPHFAGSVTVFCVLAVVVVGAQSTWTFEVHALDGYGVRQVLRL